ncbi:hypothetical protein D9M70_642070 [compost metagenome]
MEIRNTPYRQGGDRYQGRQTHPDLLGVYPGALCDHGIRAGCGLPGRNVSGEDTVYVYVAALSCGERYIWRPPAGHRHFSGDPGRGHQ